MHRKKGKSAVVHGVGLSSWLLVCGVLLDEAVAMDAGRGLESSSRGFTVATESAAQSRMFARAQAKKSKTLTSYYRDAIAFRDKNRNGVFDPSEKSTVTNSAGEFKDPGGKGRLYIKDGIEIDSGRLNDSLLAAPNKVRGVGAVTSLWQSLLDRKQSPGATKALLKVNAVTQFSAVPYAQADAATRELIIRDAQENTLLQFMKGLTLGVGNPTPVFKAMLGQGIKASFAAKALEDPIVGALADALLAVKKAGIDTDLENQASVDAIFKEALIILGVELADAERALLAKAATNINVRIRAEFDNLPTFRLVTADGRDLLAARALTTLDARYGDPGFVVPQASPTPPSPKPADPPAPDPKPTDPPPPASAQTFTLVSVAVDGSTQANGSSLDVAVSADGRYVAFASAANNLIASDDNASQDVFLRDTVANVTTLVSVAQDGSQAKGISYQPAVSDDGRYVAFVSDAENLHPGDGNKKSDVFRRDLLQQVTVPVSALDGKVLGGGAYGVSISGDGRYVVFNSFADLTRDDNQQSADIFRWDGQSATHLLISKSLDSRRVGGSYLYNAISQDGNFVTFVSNASNIALNDDNSTTWDAYLRDIAANSTELLSMGVNGKPGGALGTTNGSIAVSQDGQWIAFASDSGNLVANDGNSGRHVYRCDRRNNLTEKMSVAPDGTPGNGVSDTPSMSANGRYVAFISAASNLVSGVAPSSSTGGAIIFIRDTVGKETIALAGTRSDGSTVTCLKGAISADGSAVACTDQRGQVYLVKGWKFLNP